MVFKREKWSVARPLRKRDKHEFPKGKPGLVICGPDNTGCGAVYFKKRWQHDINEVKFKNLNLPVSFKLCPACKMIKDKQFEGKIILKNVPAKLEQELLNLINSYGKKARDRDPLDRIIDAKKSIQGIIITTTEDQLANKLVGKIKQVFKGIVSDTNFSKDPNDAVLIVVDFKG